MREMQRALPGRVAALCREEECDLVLLAGDLFDSPAPAKDWVDAVRRALEQCAVPVCVAPGNHDYCTDSSPWLTESWPENVHIFTGGPDHIDLPSLDCRVYGAGYRSMDCPGLLEGFRAEGDAKWRVGVFHGDPLSLSSPCCPVYRSMRWLALFSSLLLALWPLPLRLQIVGIYDILKSMPAMAGRKALCLKRRRLTPYRHQSTG